MIRATLALFALAVVLCLWIVMRPGNEVPRMTALPEEIADPVEVTRAAEAPLPLAAPAPAPAPADAAAAVVPHPATEDVDLSATTAGVLAALGLDVAAPATAAPDGLRDMSASVLASLSAVTGEPVPALDGALRPLEVLVADALREGRSDAYIDTLVNEAARAGTVAVPRLLVTEDGRVDTAVLLAAIVSEARAATTGEAPAIPDLPPDTPGVEVRVVQRVEETENYRFYTVQPGDSLGGIARRFYGSAARHEAIFDANRQLLSSPDVIRVGQRLVIPEL